MTNRHKLISDQQGQESESDAARPDSQGDKVISDSQGGKVMSDSQGGEVNSDSQGAKVMSDSQGGEVNSDSQGDKVISDSKGDTVIFYSQGDTVIPEADKLKLVSKSDQVNMKLSDSKRPESHRPTVIPDSKRPSELISDSSTPEVISGFQKHASKAEHKVIFDSKRHDSLALSFNPREETPGPDDETMAPKSRHDKLLSALSGQDPNKQPGKSQSEKRTPDSTTKQSSRKTESSELSPQEPRRSDLSGRFGDERRVPKTMEEGGREGKSMVPLLIQVKPDDISIIFRTHPQQAPR